MLLREPSWWLCRLPPPAFCGHFLVLGTKAAEPEARSWCHTQSWCHAQPRWLSKEKVGVGDD